MTHFSIVLMARIRKVNPSTIEDAFCTAQAQSEKKRNVRETKNKRKIHFASSESDNVSEGLQRFGTQKVTTQIRHSTSSILSRQHTTPSRKISSYSISDILASTSDSVSDLENNTQTLTSASWKTVDLTFASDPVDPYNLDDSEYKDRAGSVTASKESGWAKKTRNGRRKSEQMVGSGGSRRRSIV